MNNHRIQVLAKAIGIDEAEIIQQGESNRWYYTGSRVYRVLNEEEIKEECLFEIKECWIDWRYRTEEIAKFLQKPDEDFKDFNYIDGWLHLDTNETIVDWIDAAGVEKFALHMYNILKAKDNWEWLLEKVNDKAKKSDGYTIFQWA